MAKLIYSIGILGLLLAGRIEETSALSSPPITSPKNINPQSEKHYLNNLIELIIEKSRYGVLREDEIKMCLRETLDDKQFDQFSQLIDHSLLSSHKGHLVAITTSHGKLYTTKYVLEMVNSIHNNLQKLKKRPSAVMKLAGLTFQQSPPDLSVMKPVQKQAFEQLFQKIQKHDSSFWLIEGVPGSGKTFPFVIKIVEIILKNPSGASIYATAPNFGGEVALKEDLKDFIGKLGNPHQTVLNMEELLNNKGKELKKHDVLIVDEVYTSSLPDLKKLLDIAVDKELTLIALGDSMQNLPKAPSAIGLLKPDLQLVNSFRAKNPEMASFAKAYAETINTDQGIARALEIFRPVIKIGNSLDMEKDLIQKALELYTQSKDPREAKKNVILIAPAKMVDRFNDLFHQSLIEKGLIQNVISIRAEYPYYYLYKNRFFLNNEPLKKYRSLKIGVGSRVIALDDGPQFRKGDIFIITQTNQKGFTAIPYNNPEGKPVEFGDKAPIDFDYVKESLDSQGEGARYACVYIDKTMDTAELYVALTRHKEGIDIFAPETDFRLDDTSYPEAGLIHYKWRNFNQLAAERIETLYSNSQKRA
jgi:hypothetical protein